MAKKLTKYCVVDAFAESAFKGNPAAVCFVEEEKEEQWLQSMAAEFNLPATCYLTESVAHNSPSHEAQIPRFGLRWFTPGGEIEICGHGTLASAYALFVSGKFDSDVIEFTTLSGILTARKVPDHSCNAQNGETRNNSFLIELDFPTDPTTTELDSAEYSIISKALGGASVITIKRSTFDKLIVMLPSAEDVVRVQPNFSAIEKYPGVGIVVTGIAPQESGFDFQSRFFAPKFKLNEDHVCGSAHCALAYFWNKELGKCDFVAYQASSRGGILKLRLDDQNQRVHLQGKAVTVMEGTILA